jgi:hypothetical protein
MDPKHHRRVDIRFFRTRDACEATVQAARNKAAEEARKIDEYR